MKFLTGCGFRSPGNLDSPPPELRGWTSIPLIEGVWVGFPCVYQKTKKGRTGKGQTSTKQPQTSPKFGLQVCDPGSLGEGVDLPKGAKLPGSGANILLSLRARVRKKVSRTGASPFLHRCERLFSHQCKGLFPDSCPGGSEEFLHHFLATLPLADQLPFPGRQDHNSRRAVSWTCLPRPLPTGKKECWGFFFVMSIITIPTGK